MTRVLALCAVVFALLAGGCQSADSRAAITARARFFLEAASVDGTPLALPRSGVRLVVNSKPVLTEGDIINVELVQVDLGKCLLFQLTPSAARDLHRLSVAHQGRRLAVVINDVALGARRIDGPIGDGSLFMFVELPEAELPVLVEKLKTSSAALQREIVRRG